MLYKCSCLTRFPDLENIDNINDTADNINTYNITSIIDQIEIELSRNYSQESACFRTLTKEMIENKSDEGAEIIVLS